ncbi:MAG: sulfotransferase domain-containing protein [Acidobacteriia bacterium]|nr:sulfotransferase domain-containing protein [Terriglobia bacterium]
MMYSVKKLWKNALGMDIAGRTLAVRADDTFIISYPRSGNTWTRFLIANLMHPQEPVTFANIERFIPDAEAQSSRYMRAVPSPRMIKSHSYFDPRYPRVIYVVRDPRDVALSYYDFSRKYRQIEDSYPLERYIEDFTTGHLLSAGWGTWGENVASWVYARGARPGFLLLRYEDMKARPEQELARIAEFLGIHASPELLRTAIERSSADRMREMEKTQGKNWVTTKDKRSDIPFVRTASVGGWKTNLQTESVAKIEARWGHIMAQLGYELVTNAAAVGGAENILAAFPASH